MFWIIITIWIIVTIIFGISAIIQINRLYKNVNEHDLLIFGVTCITITVLSTIAILIQGISGIKEIIWISIY